MVVVVEWLPSKSMATVVLVSFVTSRLNFMNSDSIVSLIYLNCVSFRPGAKYIEKYSNTLQLLSLINDYNYITITGPAEM